MPIEVKPDGLYHTESSPDRFWSTANVGEALPGIVTPLGWSVWGPAIELGIRDTFARMGALERSRVVIPENTDERMISVFYGRGALSVSFLCEMGDRLPGSSSDAIAKQLLGEVPPEIPLEPTLRRMPVVAFRMPVALAMIRRQVLRDTAPTTPWWSDWLRRIDGLDLQGAREALDDGRRRAAEMTAIQARGVFVGVQAVYDQLLALIEKAGLDPEEASPLMAGQGSHAETEIIADLWELGRERMTLEVFLERHGYHGPREGDLASRMWREDPSPVVRLASQYAARDESEHPARAAELREREREAAEKVLLARLPAVRRPMARLVLRMAVQRIPLRGVAKEALMRAMDVVRASTRRIGALLTEEGALSDPEDAFYFTADELIAGLPEGAVQIARERRELRERLQKLDIPQHWGGTPEPFEIDEVVTEDSLRVTGIAASGGVVEGPVRIVEDPAYTEVEPGEIIVCTTTDPSWASVLFLSSALVVDIGGPLSHAAVVSREVGIPCVIGTDNGTALLRTGDVVRVDGGEGTVEILSRAEKVAQ